MNWFDRVIDMIWNAVEFLAAFSALLGALTLSLGCLKLFLLLFRL